MSKTKSLPEVEPHFLYVFMRTDMQSMNPGKAVAHGAHAANQFDVAIKDVSNEDLQAGYDAWVKSGTFFGTTITLGVNEEQLHRHVASIADLGSSVVAGVVMDPTYPVRDGQVTHLIPVNTCGFAFGPMSALKALTTELSLMW